jgi:hypothetical protein
MLLIRIFLGLILLMLVACKGRNEAPNSTVQAEQSEPLPADFDAFYQKFHSDSLFQMEHIAWPLAGRKGTLGDSTQVSVAHTWSRDTWLMHRNTGLNPDEFLQKFFPIGEVIVIEKIYARGGPYGLEKRYARQTDGQWALIYYADLHEMR